MKLFFNINEIVDVVCNVFVFWSCYYVCFHVVLILAFVLHCIYFSDKYRTFSCATCNFQANQELPMDYKTRKNMNYIHRCYIF